VAAARAGAQRYPADPARAFVSVCTASEAATGLIESILPAEVAFAEAFHDAAPAPLFPVEEALVARAVDRRRAEFATARACARRALAELGVAPGAIGRGKRGEPKWPAGIVGSITHCDGYRAAAVALGNAVASAGIDAEPNGSLSRRVLEAIALPAERDRVAILATVSPTVHWDRLLFCAKEAVFKAWFPLTGCDLGFADANIAFSADDTAFTARLLVPGPQVCGRLLSSFTGRWVCAGGLLAAAIVVPRRDTHTPPGSRQQPERP